MPPEQSPLEKKKAEMLARKKERELAAKLADPNLKYFEEYMIRAKSFIKNYILKQAPNSYRRLFLKVSDSGFSHLAVGLTVDPEAGDWHYIDTENTMNNDFTGAIYNSGLDYKWLVEEGEEDEDGNVYETEADENRYFLERYLQWYALAMVALELIADDSISEHLAFIEDIEIESQGGTLPPSGFIPDAGERRAVIQALAGDEKNIDILLDGWGHTLGGKVAAGFLEHILDLSDLSYGTALAEANGGAPIPTKIRSQFLHFLGGVADGSMDQETQDTFGEEINEGKFQGFRSVRFGSGWVGYYKQNQDGVVEIGDLTGPEK